MNREDDWGFKIILGIVGAFVSVIVLADVVGRVKVLLMREWPLISSGLAILSSAMILILISRKLYGLHEEHVRDVKEKLELYERNERRLNYELEKCQERVLELKRETDEFKKTCFLFIEKVEDFSAHKMPNQFINSMSGEVMNNAASEFIKG